MNHATSCKFCKAPLVIQIDDAYAALGDPLKLLPFAACNRCADLRVRKRSLEAMIMHAVFPLMGSKSAKVIAQARAELVVLTKKYTAMVADWLHATHPWWDEGIVESIIERPDHTSNFLQMCWKMYEPTRD